MRRALLALLATLLASCSSRATPPAPVTTVATGPAAELNGVLRSLDGVMGDLQRILARERRLSEEVVDRLQAIYTGPELLNQIDAFRTDLSNGLPGYKAVPGNRVTTVSRVITSNAACTFAEVERDYAPISEGPAPPPQRLYVVLVPKDGRDDPRGLNPTSWAMLYDGVQQDGGQPEDVCR